MDIIPRKILRQPQIASPKYWYDNKAFETHFFNALSSTFPEGERFFIISVRNYAAQITDPKLKEQVERFISQEGQHSREHEAHLKLLADQGFALLIRMNRWERGVMRWFAKTLPRYALALTLTIEHVTAIFAATLLSNQARLCESMHTDYRLLWRWHAVEEIEHKAVAFDVYEQTGGGVGLRRLAAMQVAIFFPAILFLRHGLLLAKDGVLFDFAQWRRGCVFLLGRNGLLRKVMGAYSRCLSREFHPWRHNNAHHIDEFTRYHSEHYHKL